MTHMLRRPEETGWTVDDLAFVPFPGQVELFDGILAVTREGELWTAEELAHLPDLGGYYEFVEGVLYVSPSPSAEHQRAADELRGLLRAAGPGHLDVLTAPMDYQPSPDIYLQPDVIVGPRGQQRPFRKLLLAVEVLSPSTRWSDQHFKRGLYEESGVPSYWLVDPAAPSITALELRDGAYVEVGRAVGDETLALTEPFPVTITPADLIA
jgi:Uma2 family endonuclease